MHGRALHQGPRAWLIAGTGDGRRLALALQARGWRLLVSVVSPEAALAYPQRPHLALRVGPLGGESGIRAVLQQAAAAGDEFTAVVDASHPFAGQITAALAAVWQGSRAEGSPIAAAAGLLPPLLRLRRPDPIHQPVRRLQRLADLEALAAVPLQGKRLLLAIGARHLRRSVELSPGASHFARLLPSAAALQQGRAAGLAADQLACLRPGDPMEKAVLRALLRRWRIDTILCRQSGGITEELWRSLAAALDLELLVLARPAEPQTLRALELAPLLADLEARRGAYAARRWEATRAGSDP